jgi:hypothetical protein
MEFPLPQIPGLAANVMRTVPLVTRATWLAMLCAIALCANEARAAMTTAVVPATELSRIVFIC